MDQKIPYYPPHPSADPVCRSPRGSAVSLSGRCQVALGHAKSVRMAIQITGTEQYSKGKGFCDATQEGGVPEALYQKILNLSDAPGEFWVLQVGNDGYKVKQFVYREGNYTVWYQATPPILSGIPGR